MLCFTAHRPALFRNCSEFRTWQLGLCSKCRGVSTLSRYYCTSCIGCQLVQQRITLAVLTYKVRSTSTPVYLHRRIAECACSRTLRSATIPLLDKPFMRTDFSNKRAFRFSAPTVWNSLPQTVLISDLCLFLNIDLKLFCSIRFSLNTDPTCRQRL